MVRSLWQTMHSADWRLPMTVNWRPSAPWTAWQVWQITVFFFFAAILPRANSVSGIFNLSVWTGCPLVRLKSAAFT